MLLVANVSKHVVIIQDLILSHNSQPLEIPPSQAMDLHKLKFKSDPEKSSHLELAKRKGYIKELMNDSPKKEEVKEVVKDNSINKEDIISIIREEISKSKDNSQILEELSKIGNLIKNTSSNIVIQNNEKASNEDEIDEDILAKINIRTINKITKDVQSNIVVEDNKENEVDDSWANDMKDLEQL